ncbi:unnamed protein product [Urochloa decumbens]|uniref:Xylanase inhibitor C-terminal domain-containing protein n=1 Tax=Urochloa decumbens TaxID=240449 RepID=A0ABC8WHQ8_9POAL
MAKLGSSTRGPAQGMLPLPVLVLLLASVHAVPVMALEWEDVGEHVVGLGEKVMVHALGKIEGWEDFAKGVKWGFKTYKMEHKAEGLIKKLNPGPGGGTPATLLYAVDTVEVVPPAGVGGPSSMLPVVTADITATISVRTGSCAAEWMPVGLRSIKLYGRPGSLLTPPVPLTTTFQQCPGGAGAAAVLGLGRGGILSRQFPTFSYHVTSDASTVLLLPTMTASQPQQRPAVTTIPLSVSPKYPELYYVGITGIRVGGEVVVQTRNLALRPDGTGGVYLSTTEPYTYLESTVHFGLKSALVQLIRRLNAAPTLSPRGNAASQLCYVGVGANLMVPSMEILFANNAVMKLGVGNVWYREEPSTVCLAILPTTSPDQASVLGSWLQSGRVMTIDLSPRAGALAAGTLTF